MPQHSHAASHAGVFKRLACELRAAGHSTLPSITPRTGSLVRPLSAHCGLSSPRLNLAKGVIRSGLHPD
jgi:hypothetical protein